MSDRLAAFWRYFGQWTQTKSRDTSQYGFSYLSGLLRMETKRNFANIGRKTDVPTQNMHHFMSNSPWSGEGLVGKVRADVAAQDEFQRGTMLLLDESADDKSGTHTVGSGRQYNGRRGKVDNCIVGVFLSCVDASCQYHTWIDGELFLSWWQIGSVMLGLNDVLRQVCPTSANFRPKSGVSSHHAPCAWTACATPRT